MLSFAHPALLLALALPWLWWRNEQRGTETERQYAAVLHPQADLLATLDQSGGSRTPRRWNWPIGLSCLVLAMAGPQWTGDEATRGGHDIMLAVDVSGSMRALDFAVSGEPTSRLDRVQALVERFLDERQGDRVGLIAFAQDAYTLVPITADTAMVKQLLADLRSGVFGEKTALGSGILLGTKRLSAQPSPARVLIVFTDGANTAGTVSPTAAAALARDAGVKIYTVGIGSNDPVLFPRGPLERPERTQIPLDEEALREIAVITGGRYFRADHSEELQRVLDTIDTLETPVPPKVPRATPQPLYLVPLILGLALLAHRQRRELIGTLP